MYFQMESLKSDYEKTRFIVEHHVLEHTGNELLELIKDAELMEEKRRSKQTQVRIVSSMLLEQAFIKLSAINNFKSYYFRLFNTFAVVGVAGDLRIFGGF